jgi:septum formation protein
MTKLILASRSPARTALLSAAGVSFVAMPSSVEERAVEMPLIEKGVSAKEIASVLADAKATTVSRDSSGAFVIGADQTLELDGARWTKPGSVAEAREQLALLSGRTHELHSAVAVARDRAILWRHSDSARLTMRPLTATAIDAYLAEVGDAALSSVGAYQIEGPGIRLFERLDGDYFTILGLPLLPLLMYLRSEGVIA